MSTHIFHLDDNVNYVTRRAFIKLTPPLTAASVLQVGVAVVDLILIGFFCGSDGLAIATVFLGLWYLWEALLCWLGYGAATLFARAKGEKNLPQAQAIFSQALTASLLFAALLTAICLLGNQYYLDALNLPSELRATATVYGLWLAPSMALSFLSHTLLSFSSSDSNPRREFKATLIQNVLNIGLDILFMGFLGAGVVGSLYAFMLSSVAALIIALGHFSPRQTFLKIALALPRYAQLKAMLNYAYYSLSENLGTAILCAIFSGWILSTFGVAALAIYGVINSARLLRSAIFSGLLNAASLLLANYFGERNFAAIKNINKLSLATGIAVAGILWGVIAFFPHAISVLFSLSEGGASVFCDHGLRIFAAATLVAFVNAYYSVFLQVSGRGGLALLVAWLSSLLIPLIVGGIFLQFNDLNDFWYHFLFSEIVMAALLLAIAAWYRYREKITSWWLLKPFSETTENIFTYGFLIRDVRQELGDYQEMLAIFFRKYHIPETIIYHVALAVEELAVYASDAVANDSAQHYLDLQVVLEVQKQVQVTLRYESERGIVIRDLATAPTANTPNPDDELFGLRLLYKLANTFYYDRIAGFNYLSAGFKLM